jgi:hypothetical protein
MGAPGIEGERCGARFADETSLRGWHGVGLSSVSAHFEGQGA